MKIPKDYPIKEVTFAQNDSKIDVLMPVDKLLDDHMVPDFEWVCIQVNFYQQEVTAPDNIDFYPVPQTHTASVRTLDNLGRRLISDGQNELVFNDFRSRNYRISYGVEANDKAFIAANDVKCLYSNADFSVADPLDQECNAPVYRNYTSMVG